MVWSKIFAYVFLKSRSKLTFLIVGKGPSLYELKLFSCFETLFYNIWTWLSYLTRPLLPVLTSSWAGVLRSLTLCEFIFSMFLSDLGWSWPFFRIDCGDAWMLLPGFGVTIGTNDGDIDVKMLISGNNGVALVDAKFEVESVFAPFGVLFANIWFSYCLSSLHVYSCKWFLFLRPLFFYKFSKISFSFTSG